MIATVPDTTNILIVIEAQIATTYLIEQVVRACRAYGVSYRVQFLSKLDVKDIAEDTIPLFVRCADPLTLLWIKTLIDAKRVYAYYIDDNFWRITGESSLAIYYRHPVIRKSLEFAVSNAAVVITNSDELSRFILNFNDRVSVLPTFFDFSLINGVHPIPTDEVRIGFAGSPSRVEDLEFICQMIEPILSEFPRAVFEFAGVLPRNVSIGERVRFFPHTSDYNTYIKFQVQRNWAIGLAPLMDHEANRSKTDNKYREYGACHIAGIYSDIPPYSDVVQQMVTGVLVKNDPLIWFEALRCLLGNSSQRAILAENAYKHVKSRYDVSHVSREWARLFNELRSNGSENVKPLNMGSNFVKRLLRRSERMWLHLSITYDEGGASLVFERIFRKMRGVVGRGGKR